MILRALIYLQIIWIVITGLMFRGVLKDPDTWFTDMFMVAVLYGFPTCIAAALVRSGLTHWRKRFIAVVEVGLTIAYVIAIFPSIQ